MRDTNSYRSMVGGVTPVSLAASGVGGARGMAAAGGMASNARRRFTGLCRCRPGTQEVVGLLADSAYGDSSTSSDAVLSSSINKYALMKDIETALEEARAELVS
jgi:hypothetical protein